MPNDKGSPDAELELALRGRGHRVTPQRLVINRALRELDRHASADEVLALVSDRLPNVSLPTVYATLDLVEDLGLARRVRAGAGAVLYDPRVDEHHHLVCERCGRIEDIAPRLDLRPAMRAATRHGFGSSRADVVVTGLCPSCAAARR